MPKFLPPSRSGVHRLACRSLYHALLSQCSRPWLGSERGKDIRDLVTARFHRDKSLNSPSKITGSLEAGYEALDLLHSAGKGDAKSIDRVITLLDRTKPLRDEIAREKLESARLARQKQLDLEQKRERARKERESPRKPHPILDRPYPEVSGVRHVPSLTSARGIPFLRIKKPQPAKLTHMIRGMLRVRDRRLDRRILLEERLYLANLEDEWDGLLEGRVSGPGSWAQPIKKAFDEVNTAISSQRQKDLDLAKKMWKVVLKERELAEKERQERVRLGKRPVTGRDIKPLRDERNYRYVRGTIRKGKNTYIPIPGGTKRHRVVCGDLSNRKKATQLHM